MATTNAMSDYMVSALLNLSLRNVAWAIPATGSVWVALFSSGTGLDSDNPTGEFVSGDYARFEVDQTTTTFTASTNGSACANNEAWSFTQALSDWGNCTHIAIVDHATNTVWGTGVHVLYWGALATFKPISTNDTFTIGAGDLTIQIT